MVNIVNIHSEHQNVDAQKGRAAKIIAVTSGKGGVGKTNVSSNLAITLAQQGARVCVFDADTSLANINIVMGLSAQYTIEHLLKGDKKIDEILITGPAGIQIVPSASGISNCANLDDSQRQRLIAALAELEDRFDYLIIDTAAGIGHEVIDFVRSAQYILLVITTEPTSLTDTFALIRTLKGEGCKLPLYAVVSQARDYPDSWKIFARFQGAVKKFLKTDIRYLGYIGQDSNLREAVISQKPVVLFKPRTHASRCFKILANIVQKQFAQGSENHSFSEYWRRLTIVKSSANDDALRDNGSRRSANTAKVMRADAMVEWIDDDGVTEQQATDSLSSVMTGYIKRFGKFPLKPQQLLQTLLVEGEFSQERVRELLQGLEAEYAKRYKQPVNDLEATVSDLLLALGMPVEIAAKLKQTLSQQR